MRPVPLGANGEARLLKERRARRSKTRTYNDGAHTVTRVGKADEVNEVWNKTTTNEKRKLSKGNWFQ